MAKVIFQSSARKESLVEIKKGQTILRAARQGRIELRHKCGGKASCTTCKVIIADQSGISPVFTKEIRKLGEENIDKGLRLSCQTQVFHEVVVKIPEDPYKARIHTLLQQQNQDNKW